MGPFESALRSARALGATTIRCGLTPVLCGDRAALGDIWLELVASVRGSLAEYGPRVADEGMVLAIENHQDFTSDELVEFSEATRGVGICVDAGNTFPVLEAPMDFTRASPRMCATSISKIAATSARRPASPAPITRSIFRSRTFAC